MTLKEYPYLSLLYYNDECNDGYEFKSSGLCLGCENEYSKGKILDQYSNLYREFNSENFDYYGITDGTSYPLCKLDHDDEESIYRRYQTTGNDLFNYFLKI
ncbi:uncharacterized protein OCT59_024980 [Rhizophagus irregularis]|uniref:uncharacterized protein n=1 Tax=Rhizophagus irregularis TaxID=588596 RepID=UPI00331EC3F7|nr:hypothetical protein OCT59_024980 [Rhizophagus irregularis]